MAKKPADLTIVLVNYNGGTWLEMTLSSLKKWYLDQTKTVVRVVMVDNASTDGSVAHTKKHFPWVEIIELKANTGFAHGNNVALETVDSEFVMLLNTDVEFDHRSNLDLLMQYLQSNEAVGVVSPRLELPQGGIDPASHRGEPTPWASFTYMSGLEKLFPKTTLFGQYHQYYKPLHKPHAIDACSGAAMMLKRAAMERVGLLDESFFMYGEDLDWCKRFREQRYEIHYLPDVVVTHHKNKSGIGSSKQEVAKKTSAHFYDTMLQYFDKHYAHVYPKWMRHAVSLAIQYKKKRKGVS